MRKLITLLLIIFSSCTTAFAQQLYSDSTGIQESELSMVLPPDTSHVATIVFDTIPVWFDNEEGWRFPNYGLWYPPICVSDMVWLTFPLTVTVTEITPPLTQTALGLIAADAPSCVRSTDVHHSARAAEHFESLVST